MSMRPIKPKSTYREWLVNLLKLVTPREDLNPIDIEIINDTYINPRVWKVEREASEAEKSRRVHVQGFYREMLKGNEWLAFFNNIKNKTALIKMATNFFKTEDGKKQLSVPLIFTQKEETWMITRDAGARSLFKCNHEGADTRLILHACLQDTNVLVVAKGTDVFYSFSWSTHIVYKNPHTNCMW